jgi:hypothetical protein
LKPDEDQYETALIDLINKKRAARRRRWQEKRVQIDGKKPVKKAAARSFRLGRTGSRPSA